MFFAARLHVFNTASPWMMKQLPDIMKRVLLMLLLLFGSNCLFEQLFKVMKK
jgi:hypothetical protein